MTKPRMLRHNLSAEASILGGILLRNDVLGRLDMLETDAFYDHRHRVVWMAIRNLQQRESPIDVVTLQAEIARAEKLEAIGGVAFLGELALQVPTPDNVVAYAEIVQEAYATRRLALVAAEILERCYDGDCEPTELFERASTELARLASNQTKPDDIVSIGELAKRRLRELDDIVARRAAGETNVMTGLPTGVDALDRRVGGWQLGVLNMIAARPGMGKSALAVASADACTKAGYGVHVFSLEDSWKTYVDRCLSRRSGVAAELIRQANLESYRDGQSDFGRVVHAVAHLAHRPTWFVDDRKGLSASEIIRAVRLHKARIKTRLIVVDYIHLVRRNPRLDENHAIDEIVTAFAAAVEPDEAWLVCSQLNRKLEDRPDKRPMQADLRGSGALEERPKVIVGLYRGAVYGGKPRREVDYVCPPSATCPDNAATCIHAPSAAEWDAQAQLIVMKNSNGASPARIFASWHGATLEIW